MRTGLAPGIRETPDAGTYFGGWPVLMKVRWM
jgi:hypothetical protein